MSRKFMALAMPVVALVAFAVSPALAAASPQLIQGGSAVATGTALTATNTSQIVFNTGSGSFACTKAQLSGTVTKNSGSLINADFTSGSITGPLAEGKCSDTTKPTEYAPFKVTLNNLPWCLSSSVAGQWSLRGGSCAEAAKPFSITLTYTIGGFPYPCRYTRSSLSFNSNVNSEPLILQTAASQVLTKAEGGSICASSPSLSMLLKLQANGGELKVQ